MKLKSSSIICRHTLGNKLPMVAFARNVQPSEGWDYFTPEELY